MTMMKTKPISGFGVTALLAMAVVLGLAWALAGESAAPHPQQASKETPAMSSEKRTAPLRVFDETGQLRPARVLPRLLLSPEQWKKRLSPQQFAILRAKGTERPFCGTLLHNDKEGVYVCAGCGLPLFATAAKFDSGTGWPSFFQPIAKENITEVLDLSHGMRRTEIMCARCDGHLGHVFDDGPRPTGLRYCLNSESLRFVPRDQLKSLAEKVDTPDTPDTQTAP